MAEEEKKEGPDFIGNAADANISLSQALLAPLDAIFKAQLHSARSFLNLLLQLGYKPEPEGGEETEGAAPGGGASPEKNRKDDAFNLEFYQETQINGERRVNKICVPALALVPIAPLAVENAEFNFNLSIRKIYRHRQVQPGRSKKENPEEAGSRYKRPWFLVDEPVSMRGVLNPSGGKEGEAANSQQSTINISVKIGRVEMPAGVNKLLTSLTQNSKMEEMSREKIDTKG